MHSMQHSGVFNAQKFLVYKKKRGAFSDEDDHLKTSNLGRCHFDTDSKGYDPEVLLESKWYRRYVKYPDHPLSKKNLKSFSYEKWFPNNEKFDRRASRWIF